jgi:hypothetical protein
MESERTPKCLLNGELFGVCRRGSPRKRLFQDVKDDLRQMRILNGNTRHRNEIHGGELLRKPKPTKGCRAENEEEEKGASKNSCTVRSFIICIFTKHH